MKEHHYEATIRWTGNLGKGTSSYSAYSRSHEISGDGKPVIPGSSDTHFRGDAGRFNPEELLVASLSSCHMLWYLHLCAVNKIVVTAYEDTGAGWMNEMEGGSGAFTKVILRPKVTVSADSDLDVALRLHEKAQQMCFIANSVRFPVLHEPSVVREAR